MTRASGYDRTDDDWYVEPPEAVHALLDAEPFPQPIYDPACGGGNIVKACWSRGLGAHGADLVQRDGDRFPARDFLEDGAPDLPIGSIITNPPYGPAQGFIRRSLALVDHKAAFLLRLSFLESEGRAALFDETPLARVYVLRWRISMPPGELLRRGKVEAKGGSIAYAWFVWELGWQGPPQIRWLSRP